MIRVNDERYWLYAAVDPETNKFLHVKLSPTYSIVLSKQFLAELSEKHNVADATFLIDDATDLETALRQQGFAYRIEIHGLRNTIERVFREGDRRISSFSNCFSHVHPPTAESWINAFAVW